MRAPRGISPSPTAWSRGYYELGSVLDGTFKKFAPETRVPRTGRIKCGTESNGGFINVTISNCVFEGCLGYALESVDGALLEDFAITNTTMRDLRRRPSSCASARGCAAPKRPPRSARSSASSSATSICHNAPQRISSILSGIPGHAIEDVKFSNIYVETAGGGTADDAQSQPPRAGRQLSRPGMFGAMPASGFFLRHVRNLEMSHVEIAANTPRRAPSILFERCGSRRLLRHHRAAQRRGRLCVARCKRPAHRLEPRRRRHRLSATADGMIL